MVLKLFSRIALLVFPILIMMASINYMVDPALILHEGEYERQIAQGLLEKRSVTMTGNYNERKVQRLLIEGISEAPDGIIIGSSRIMSIPLNALGIQNGYCNGVSGAVIEDIISIIGMYDAKDILPKAVFMGVDPFLFNDHHGDSRYLELITEYNAFSKKLGLQQMPVTIQSTNWYVKVSQALSPTYFQASIGNIHRGLPRPVIGDVVEASKIVEYRPLPEEKVIEVNQGVISYINSGHLYYSENYNELSSQKINQFVRLIDYLESKGVSVTFILTPLHPLYYAHIAENKYYHRLIDAEAFTRKFAEDRGIPVIGSVDPGKAGAVAADFTDFMHPTTVFMAKMCKR